MTNRKTPDPEAYAAHIRAEVAGEADRAHRSGVAEAQALLKRRHFAHGADLDGSNPRSVRHTCGPMCAVLQREDDEAREGGT